MSFTTGESAIIELAKRAYTAGGYDLAALLLFGMLRKWWRLERVEACRETLAQARR